MKDHQPIDDLNNVKATEIERVTRRVYSLKSAGKCVVEGASYDQVIIEAPLQIILVYFCNDSRSYLHRPLMVTMRTPGHDHLLVSGLLLTSSIVTNGDDIVQINHTDTHTVEVTLRQTIVPDWSKLQRQGLSSSSCGVCGQEQIKQLAIYQLPVSNKKEQWLSPSEIVTLPKQLKILQPCFKETGGVHAAGLWHQGRFLAVQEDVGRHNAVDKIIGHQLTLTSDIDDFVLVLSGRISFELVQKAIMANIPVIVAVGAPSSLAIALAKQFNITIVGFTKSQQFNLYSGEFRLR